MPTRARTSGYAVTVRLDLSDVVERRPDDQVKVVGQAADGTVVSAVHTVAELEKSPVRLGFDEPPGLVRVAIGPPEAEDRQVLDADTITAVVPSRLWEEKPGTIELAPIRIGRWYWGWWQRWCRTITVRGRVLCADGRTPVPGAEVCADDLDLWFIWSSRQRVACATTGPDGSFTMTFDWCCGLYPWWWWFQIRPWNLDLELERLVGRALDQDVAVRVEAPTALPSLAPFRALLDTREAPMLSDLDPEKVEAARLKLVDRLPRLPEADRLQIWPWAPWHPWLDCTPDLVFSASQVCDGQTRTIVSEGISEVRWNVPDVLDVTLIASADACCRPDHPTEECLAVDAVCDYPMSQVAGNLGAPAGEPAAVTGYLLGDDRPFGGGVPIDHNPSDLVGIDYYAVEHSTDGGVTWNPLPAGASQPFTRLWQEHVPVFDSGAVTFAPTPAGAYDVYETRLHVENATPGVFEPIGNRFWLSPSFNRLISLDSTRLVDGVHHFRVVEFTRNAAGEFEGPTPIVDCDGEHEVGFVLAIDNRAISSVGHDPSHNCGAGVHVCTTEPDTHILAVRVGGVPVGPCDVISSSDGDLEVDFLAHDPDGHLGSISLTSHYGNSALVDLSAGSLVSLDGGPDAWTYAQALADGAVRPIWTGGTFRLTIDASVAFPVPCCYLLRLQADKRTLESCAADVRNVSELTLGIGV